MKDRHVIIVEVEIKIGELGQARVRTFGSEKARGKGQPQFGHFRDIGGRSKWETVSRVGEVHTRRADHGAALRLQFAVSGNRVSNPWREKNEDGNCES
jgi:hypothetical protein